MSLYGYTIHTFHVRKPRKRSEPRPLGDFDGQGRNALVYIYGILNGITQEPIAVGTRHLRLITIAGAGETIRFSAEIGHSGQSSQFYEPGDNSKPVFERSDHHIEAGLRRGLIVAPARSQYGLLVMEVRGRSGARTLLTPTLSRAFKSHTQHILDIASVVDQDALENFITEARAQKITLRRRTLPSDIANVVHSTTEESQEGKLELTITPGKRVRQFKQAVVEKLRGDNEARRKLLSTHGLEFDELSVNMTVGDRKTTLTVTADRIPSFIYNLPGRTPIDDEQFYEEAIRTAGDVASATGVRLSTGWESGAWPAEDRAYTLPVNEEADHVLAASRTE